MKSDSSLFITILSDADDDVISQFFKD
jgi:hypothetical protein